MAFLPAGAAANPTRSYIADWNRDGQLDARDIEAFFEALKVGSARADLNRDGRIDAEDLALFMQAFVAGEEFSLLAC